jgi:hypothetical protein
VSKCLEVQFDRLIVQPFHRFLSQGQVEVEELQGLILVEGLDKCKSCWDRREILRVILRSKDALPFRWLIFSRPDCTLEDGLVKDGFSVLEDWSAQHSISVVSRVGKNVGLCGVVIRLESNRPRGYFQIIIGLTVFFL